MIRRRTKLVTLGLFVLAGATLAFAIRQWGRARREAARVVQLVEERDRWAASRELSFGLPPPTTEARSGPQESRPAESLAEGEPTSPEPWERLRDEAMVADVRRGLRAFWARAGLSADKTADLIARIVIHNQTLEELKGASRARLEEENTRLRVDLENLLGREDYRAYEGFRQNQRHWQQVERLAARLYDSGAPLTPLQADRLGEMLIAHAAEADGTGAHRDSYREGVISQAALILSPPQLALFEALYDHQQLWRQINRLRFQEAARAEKAL